MHLSDPKGMLLAFPQQEILTGKKMLEHFQHASGSFFSSFSSSSSLSLTELAELRRAHLDLKASHQRSLGKIKALQDRVSAMGMQKV